MSAIQPNFRDTKGVISRADLLWTLKLNPDLDLDQVAGCFGFGFDFDDRELVIKNEHEDESTQNKVSAKSQVPPSVMMSPPTPPRYWHCVRCEPVEPEASADEQDDDSLGKAKVEDVHCATHYTAEPLDVRCLFSKAELRNLWDQITPQKISRTRINIRQTARLLARGEPVVKVVAKQRKGWNRSVTLLLDWSETTLPLHRDMTEMWDSLQQVLGEENLQTFSIPNAQSPHWRTESNKTVELGMDAFILTVGL